MHKHVFLAAAAFAFVASPAFAQTNLNFETGNLAGWVTSGSAAAATSHTGYKGTQYTAPQGNYFAKITAGCYTSYIAQKFDLVQGQTIRGYAAFDARDYTPYNDSAKVVITAAYGGSSTAWYSDVYTVGTYGDGPWQQWSFTAPSTGNYKFVYQVSNYSDCGLSSVGMFDSACSDTDGDGVCDEDDNCPEIANADQTNTDGDTFGDVCDICPFDQYNDADGDSVCGDVDACPNTAASDIAAGVPSEYLNINHFADTDGDGIFDTSAPGSKGKGKGGATGPQFSFTIAQTAGCNCAQIIDALELGNGHTKFGCSIGVMKSWLDYLANN